MKCVKILLKDTEKVRRKLFSAGFIDTKYKISAGKKYSYIPVIGEVSGFNIINKNLIKKNKAGTSLKDLLKNKLNSEEISLIKKAHDIVGDVAIVELDERLLKKKKVIANAFRAIHKNIRSVVRKVGGHEGKYRVQRHELISGDKNLVTLHKESGVIVKLDISKVYFSPRLAGERLRVAKSIKKGENILVMFSGAGIYCFVIAKHSNANEVYGVEINPEGHSYALESLKLNKFRNVKLFLGDVKKVVPKLNKKFDRIIMPLPASSLKFLNLALKHVNDKGIIHFYFFSDDPGVKSVVDFIKKKCKCRILKIVRCGQQSPKIYRWCVDFKVYR